MFSNVYLNSIAIACVAFPFAAAIVTLPYLIVQYRRFGSVPWWRTLVVYLFVLYLIAAYFLVILPLPSEDVYVAHAAHPQLVPFSFVGDIASAAHATSGPAAWLAMLGEPAVYQLLFNVLLTVPFGFFLRYYFNRSWRQVLISGFLWSLFFEISQLTGLFGAYRHPYRLFDVDDLIANTAGAMVGFGSAILLARVLPDMDEVNQEAWEKGSHATFTRRAVSFSIDVFAALALAEAATAACAVAGLQCDEARWTARAVSFSVCFVLAPALPISSTPGQMLLGLRIVSPDGSPVPWWRRASRYPMLFLLVAAAPLAFFGGLPSIMHATEKWVDPLILAISMLVGLGIWAASIVVRAIRSAMGHPFVMINGLITGTRIAPAPRAGHARAPWRERLARKRAGKRKDADG